jgi:hypothetical protein
MKKKKWNGNTNTRMIQKNMIDKRWDPLLDKGYRLLAVHLKPGAGTIVNSPL